MRRPVGVSALTVIFDAVAAFFFYCGVGAIFTADHIKGLFFLVVAFMSAALGIGLWDLAEDARRAAIAFFLIPSTFGIVVGLISAFQESPPPPSGDVVFGIAILLIFGSPAIYLMRPRVKGAFDQLLTIHFED